MAERRLGRPFHVAGTIREVSLEGIHRSALGSNQCPSDIVALNMSSDSSRGQSGGNKFTGTQPHRLGFVRGSMCSGDTNTTDRQREFFSMK